MLDYNSFVLDFYRRVHPRYHMAADILMSTVQQALNFGVQRAELRILPKQQPQTVDS